MADTVPTHRCRINRKPIVYFQVNFVNLPVIDTVAQVWSCEFTLRGWTSGLKGARVWTSVDEPGRGAFELDPRWQDDAFTRPLDIGDWEPRLRISNMVSTDKWNMNCKWLSGAKEEMEFKWTIQGTFLEQLEIHAFPRDVQALQIKITSTTPQFVIRPDMPTTATLDGAPVAEEAILARLDELSDLSHRSLEIDVNSTQPLTARERERLANLIAWRKDEDRIQRVLRLAPHYEVKEEDPLLWEKNGLSEADMAEIHGHLNVVQTSNFGMSNVWSLSEHVRMRTYHTRSFDSGTRVIKPCLNISLLATRRPEYYLWNIELPMFVLTSLTGMVWAIPPSDTADRLSVSLTLVLTAVAYKLTVAQSIPQVAYLTQLDQFVGICFAFMVFAAVENAAVSSYETDRTITSADTLVGIIWAALWVLYVLSYVGAVLRLKAKRVRALRDYTQSSNTGKAIATREVQVDGAKVVPIG